VKAEAARFVRFATVGAMNTALTLATFALLTHARVPPTLASLLAFAIGAVNGYVLNRSWTFHAAGGPGTLVRYVLVQAAGAACSAGGMALGVTAVRLPGLLAECIVVPAVTLVTYTLSRRLVFRPSAVNSADARSDAGRLSSVRF
jgi:putative flippase GtrA